MWKSHRQKLSLITTAHLLTSKRVNTREVTSHAKIWFHKHDTPERTHTCVRGHSALTSESLGHYQHDDVTSAKKILPTKNNKTANTPPCWFERPIRVHFRWPCLRISRVWQGGNRDICRLCQFLWDSAEQTAIATRATGRWQMVSSGVDMCLLVKHIKRCESFEEPVHWIGQFIAFAIYLVSGNKIINLCFDFFNVGGGVNLSGNRQNLRKTKWRPWSWNPRFGTVRCYTRTVTML